MENMRKRGTKCESYTVKLLPSSTIQMDPQTSCTIEMAKMAQTTMGAYPVQLVAFHHFGSPFQEKLWKLRVDIMLLLRFSSCTLLLLPLAVSLGCSDWLFVKKSKWRGKGLDKYEDGEYIFGDIWR